MTFLTAKLTCIDLSELFLSRRGDVRPLDEQILGQELNEGLPHPGRHLVGGRRAEVHVENSYSDDHTEGDQDHGEQQILKTRLC